MKYMLIVLAFMLFSQQPPTVGEPPEEIIYPTVDWYLYLPIVEGE